MRIGQLPSVVSSALTDYIATEQSGATLKTTLQNILNLFKSNTTPADIGAVASDDSGWLANSAGTVRYRKKDGFVTVVVYGGSTVTIAANAWTTLFTLPSGYAPDHNIYGALGGGAYSSTNHGTLRVDTSGNVAGSSTSAFQYAAGSVTYPVTE